MLGSRRKSEMTVYNHRALSRYPTFPHGPLSCQEIHSLSSAFRLLGTIPAAARLRKKLNDKGTWYVSRYAVQGVVFLPIPAV
jgi:hypothetical protein